MTRRTSAEKRNSSATIGENTRMKTMETTTQQQQQQQQQNENNLKEDFYDEGEKKNVVEEEEEEEGVDAEMYLQMCVSNAMHKMEYQNAIFIAERLFAVSKTEENALTLARCYRLNKQPYRTYEILKDRRSRDSRYFFASAAYEIGKLADAETTLTEVIDYEDLYFYSDDETDDEDDDYRGEENRNPNIEKATKREMRKRAMEEENATIPGGAYGEHLLGKIAKDTGRRQLAIDCFKRALELDPFMWAAFNELCSMGADDITFAHTKRVETMMMRKRTSFDREEEDVIFFGAPNFNAANVFSPEVFSTGGGGGGGGGGSRYTHSNINSSMFLRRKPAMTFNSSIRSRGFPGNHTATGPTTVTRGAESALPPFDLGDHDGQHQQQQHQQQRNPADGMRYVTPSPLHLGIHETPVVPRKPPQHGGKPPASTASTAFNTNDPVVLTQQTAPLGGDGVSSNPFNDRRKFMDEGKLRKVSGRLFGDAPESAITTSTTATTTHAAHVEALGNAEVGLRRSSRLASQGAAPSAAPAPPASNIFALGTQTPSIASTPMTPAQMFDQTTTTAKKNDVGMHARMMTEEDHNRANQHLHSFSQFQLQQQNQQHIVAMHRSAVMSTQNVGEETKLVIPKDSVAMVARIFHPIMSGARHLAMFRCHEAIAALRTCSPEQFETVYVLTQIGRAYAEAVEYTESARAFERAREIAPHNLDGIDCYSTVLWHLKREVELSHLAREAQTIDRLHPHTWCALGNCFSLQREHDSALRFFARAIQLNPKYAYGYTLRGHEHFANEDFEKATECYRAALSLDPRHYNAWYGLGTVYFRQEKYEMSEHHFKHAIEINSKSSVLFCYLGMAQHALRKTEKAYVSLQKAIQLDERNPLAKYEKASVLMSEERYSEALDELEQLREVAPREASVYFLMGRIFKKLEMPNRAMLNFSLALDLKPSSADVNSIKAAIEKLHVPEEEEEEEL